jgi:hypothetical protein
MCFDLAGPSRGLGSFAPGEGKAAGCRRQGKKIVMMTLIKIAVAALITFGVLNPSFTPRGEDAKCSCKADA